MLREDFEGLANAVTQRAVEVVGMGLEIIMVADGARFPAKHRTDEERSSTRAKSVALIEYHGAEVSQQAIRAAVKLRWPAVRAVLAALRTAGIATMVAPFEADSQLAFLA